MDTLFDRRLTSEMLAAYERAAPGARFDMLVNTHANGDHTFGNQLLRGARIVASERCAREMADVPPALLAGLMREAPRLGLTGAYLQRIFGTFDFETVELTLPTETFSGRLELEVGGKRVELIEVGPAHTRGDLVVHVPGDRTVFTADIVFVGGHPIMWAGPVENWLRALDLLLGLDVETIVPGHGPLTDTAHVRRLKGYFEHLDREARARHGAGMPVAEAARDIPLQEYADWGEAERVVANVMALYREYEGAGPASPLEVFAAMAELDRELGP